MALCFFSLFPDMFMFIQASPQDIIQCWWMLFVRSTIWLADFFLLQWKWSEGEVSIEAFGLKCRIPRILASKCCVVALLPVKITNIELGCSTEIGHLRPFCQFSQFEVKISFRDHLHDLYHTISATDDLSCQFVQFWCKIYGITLFNVFFCNRLLLWNSARIKEF